MLIRILLLSISLSLTGCAITISLEDVIGTEEDVDKDHIDFPEALSGYAVIPINFSYRDVPIRVVLLDVPEAKTTVFHYGGNGYSAVSKANEYLPMLASIDASGVFFDYPRGKAEQTGIYNLSFYEGLHESIRMHLQPYVSANSRIVHWGHSIGSYFAAKSALEHKENLVLQAPILSVDEMIKLHTPTWLNSIFDVSTDVQTSKMNVCKILEGYSGKLLLLASDTDDIAPLPMVEDVHKCAGFATTTMIVVKNASHTSHLEDQIALEKVKEWF